MLPNSTSETSKPTSDIAKALDATAAAADQSATRLENKGSCGEAGASQFYDEQVDEAEGEEGEEVEKDGQQVFSEHPSLDQTTEELQGNSEILNEGDVPLIGRRNDHSRQGEQHHHT
eukprot:GHVN01070646.1.p2 GENE.GHVN01070646.1~~GHVN01070646.1.p2  ORF type:complete len:117 (-),score=23.11 GHVN01070646.1:467-817(-)